MKKKKQATVLTDLQKKYVKLVIAQSTNINYDQWNKLFAELAVELDVPEDIVRRFADEQPDLPVPVEPVRTSPAPELTPQQKQLRSILTQPSITGKQSVTVMSDPASAQIEEQMKNIPVKGSSRYSRNVYRGNK